jgi:hypothetical protein
MRLYVAALVVFGTRAVCFALGGEGHELVALIAEDQLSSQAEAAVAELVGGAAMDAEVVIATLPDLLGTARWRGRHDGWNGRVTGVPAWPSAFALGTHSPS